jgi:predicted kinase
MLVVVCGLPGVGKTTVARMIADRLGVEPLRTDVVRRELFPDPTYSDEERRAVYEALFDRARERLDRGTDVVLDGTFTDAAPRERTHELAAAAGTERRLVEVTCEESVVRERIAGRTDDESDADFEVYRTLESTFEPLAGAHATVDNSGGHDALRRQVAALF